MIATSASNPPPPRSANADWMRALQRTAAITPASTRTLPTVLDVNAAAHPARPALLGETASLTYAELASLSHRYAHWALRQGLRKGDSVALLMDNRPDYVAIWLGLARVGVVTALLNTQLAGSGLAHCLALAEPRRIIVGVERLPAIVGLGIESTVIWVHGADAPLYRRIDHAILDLSDAAPDCGWPAVSLRDPALLIYTSGTTGLPKAAHVSHYRIMMWSEWFAGIMGASGDDRLYNCLPMYHSIGGVVAIGAMLVSGGSVVLRKTFSARGFWADVARSGATIFQYIGELCRFLLAAPPEQSPGLNHTLRLCCGNGLREDIWTRFQERFAIPRIIEFYAATEGSFSLFNLEGKPGAIGRIPSYMAHRSPVALIRFDADAEQPIRGGDGFCIRCAADEPGEAVGLIAADAADLARRFEGYTSSAETERKILRDVFEKGDSWFRTGDLMKKDPQGFFFFVDRIGDTFRWKGENVATAEVADALCACPGVTAAAVYGVRVPHMDGRAGMAALVVEPGFSIEDLSFQIETRLPRFARPVFIRLLKSMDTTGTFKLKKADLVQNGFDPNTISDGLFIAKANAYLPLDAAIYAAISSGTVRL